MLLLSNHEFRAGPPSRWRGGRIAAFLVASIVTGGAAVRLPEPHPSAGGTAADYQRAAGLRERFAGKVFDEKIEPRWFGEDDRFLWFRSEVRGQVAFRLADAGTGEVRPAFDHAAVAAALSDALGEPVDSGRLPITVEEFEADASAVTFTTHGRRWRFHLESGTLEETAAAEAAKEDGEPSRERRRRGDRDGREHGRGGSGGEVLSPDGKWSAMLRDHDVFVRSVADGEEIQLSHDGSEDDGFVPPLLWSPDSGKLAVHRLARGDERLVQYVDSAPDDQLQPKAFTRVYAKPGDVIDVRVPHVFEVRWEGRRWAPDPAVVADPFTTRALRWRDDSSGVLFEHVERGMGVHRIVEIDASTGGTRVVVDEVSETFVDVFHKSFRHDLGDADEILWTSERDGWNHLYLFDGRSGALKRQVTSGNWIVRSIERVDEESRTVTFRASGREPGEDPYFIHWYRVGIDAGEIVRLTEGDGTHEVRFSPARRFLVDTWSRVDRPPVHELRRVEDGSLVCRLAEADAADLIAAGWRAPETFTSKDREGKFDIWGHIIRPTNFDPGRTYPVIECIYAGPQGSFVPKSFRVLHGMDVQELAELGFIVVRIDGRGTSNRCREFHHFCYRNLADAGLPDRIAWMKAAADQHPQMDLERVGIYGGSAGGQSALGALLFHGDFYDAAAADCGCHDNRMDKLWWNEQWMDWPIGPHYEAQSNAVNAHRLEGNLLLSVGELDTNVDPASTMQVVDALIKADKDFELLVVPGAGHGVGESPYAARRRLDFFVRSLLGVEPRRQG